MVGVPREEHENLLLKEKALRETLGKTQSALDATQAILQTLKLDLTRIEPRLDILGRI